MPCKLAIVTAIDAPQRGHAHAIASLVFVGAGQLFTLAGT
jgi:hypothetical protein